MRGVLIAVLFAIALSLSLTGCESTQGVSTPAGVNISLNDKPLVVHEGTRIVTRDSVSGRFMAPQVIDP